MPAEALSTALEREHREIDGGIEHFVAHLDHGEMRAEPLREALRALRRHIYLEEEFVFPPISQAGMAVPVLVMLREHGQIWHTMDALAGLLDGPAEAGRILACCRALLAQLARHNAKEEPVLYPRADADLSAEASADLTRFLRTGATPDGWACRQARR